MGEKKAHLVELHPSNVQKPSQKEKAKDSKSRREIREVREILFIASGGHAIERDDHAVLPRSHETRSPFSWRMGYGGVVGGVWGGFFTRGELGTRVERSWEEGSKASLGVLRERRDSPTATNWRKKGRVSSRAKDDRKPFFIRLSKDEESERPACDIWATVFSSVGKKATRGDTSEKGPKG